MNRKKYLGILAIITVACIIGGSLIHGIARQHRLAQYASEFQEARQEIKEEFADDLDEDIDDLDEEIREDLEEDLTDDQAEKAEDTLETHEDAAKDHSNETALEGTAGVAFTGMDLKLGPADLDIMTGTDFGVTYYVSDDKYIPTAEYKDGILYLKQDEKMLHGLDMKDFFTANKVQITVTVPQNTTLDGVKVDMGSGNLHLNGTGGLTAKAMDLDTGSGNVEIANLTTETLSLDTGSGEVEIASLTAQQIVVNHGSGDLNLENLSAKAIDIDSGSGECELENVVFDTLDINGGSGDISVEGIADMNTYLLDLDAGSGTIFINGQREGDEFNWNPTDGTTGRYIRIDGGSGDIKIGLDD
ncbi:MAG: DUF4097 domain-containing protein [Lachnospiraceae bacterium]|nr:DUF4097 domain-containing protein [Lachnospiraceae bacterium]